MFYQGTITALRAAIERKAPGTKAEFHLLPSLKVAPLPYLLWMCDEVEKMDTSSVEEAVKAARWMGWIFAHIELHGIWDNMVTRDHVRTDRRAGLDRPHPS